VNQTRPHCVIQMGKTHSKPLAARHGRRTAWARHAMCESALRQPSMSAEPINWRPPKMSYPSNSVLVSNHMCTDCMVETRFFMFCWWCIPV